MFWDKLAGKDPRERSRRSGMRPSFPALLAEHWRGGVLVVWGDGLEEAEVGSVSMII